MKIDFNKASYALLGVLFIIYILIILSGCATEKRCNAKYPPTVETITNHTKEIVRRDSIIEGSIITNTIYKDSIVMMPVNQWRVIKDTSGRAELRYYKDAFGNINAQYISNSQMIEKLTQIESKGYYKGQTKVVTKTEVPKWVWLVFGFIIPVLLTLIFKNKFNGILKRFL